MLQSEGKQ